MLQKIYIPNKWCSFELCTTRNPEKSDRKDTFKNILWYTVYSYSICHDGYEWPLLPNNDRSQNLRSREIFTQISQKGFVFNFGISCDTYSSTLCSDRQFVSTLFTVTFSLVHQSLWHLGKIRGCSHRTCSPFQTAKWNATALNRALGSWEVFLKVELCLAWHLPKHGPLAKHTHLTQIYKNSTDKMKNIYIYIIFIKHSYNSELKLSCWKKANVHMRMCECFASAMNQMNLLLI